VAYTKTLATVTERICLYLDNFQSYEGELEGPVELTQNSIAESVGVARGNLTRAILPLIEKKWVETRKVHIPGIRQKRDIYYLCQVGRLESTILRQKIMRLKLKVKDINGKFSNMTVGRLMKIILPEAQLEEILTETLKNNIFDCRSFLKHKHQKGKLTPKQIKINGDAKHFHGRDEEVARIREWLNSHTKKTLVIKGMPGIGKSTLIANMMDEMALKHKICFFNINPWCPLRPLVLSLAETFEEFGRKELKAYLNEQPAIEMHDLEYILSSIFSNQKMILIFDNFQNANKELMTFFSMLMKAANQADDIKLVVLGRDVEPFYERAAVAVEKTVLELTLEGLSESGTQSLARSFEIPEERMDAIIAQTGGHPLFIELLVHGEKFNGNMDLERFIADEFANTLKKDENELLKYLSVFRFPVERGALRSYQPALFGLLNKSILKQSEDDFIIQHDILKDAFYRQLSDAKLKKYHSKAAEYYLESLQISSQVEALHHLIYAGRADSAAELMALKAEKLLKGGNMESLARILTILLSRDLDISPQERALLLYAQGTALAFIGEIDSALENFNRSIDLVIDKDNPIWVKSKLGIAKIMLRQNKYEESEALLREILEWAREHKDFEIEAEVNYRLGAIYERLGVPEQALRHFKNAWNISLQLNDKNQLAQASWGIGRIYHVELKFEKALKSKNEALDIAFKSSNNHLASKILTSIGGTLSEMGCLKEAIDANDRAIDLARKSGAIRVLAYTLSNAGAGYIDKPNLVQASEYLEEALFLFEKVGERRMIATVKLNMANIMVLRGKPHEGSELFREVKIILDALKDKGELMIAYFKFGQAMKKINQSPEATKLLKKALQISREIGDSDVSEQIIREMQDLLDAA
jgi:tetratricopeptide (TPR) repeat protein